MTKEEISAAYDVELANVERLRNIGLVTPKRMGDGTLVYSEADGEMIQRLLFLEATGFLENDFIALRSGEKTVESLLQRQISRLEDGCLGKEICREILEQGEDLHSFDGKSIWSAWVPMQRSTSFLLTEAIEIRFFVRGADILPEGLMVVFIIYYGKHFSAMLAM